MGLRRLAPLVLIAVVGVAAWRLVPCRWIPVALDPEFAGWVAPLSNRFADGMVLYTDGAHSPLPPVPFVLLYAVGGGQATWRTESAVNLALLGVTALVTYAAIARATSPAVAFVAVLAALPVFLASRKSLAYDAVVQALVACGAWLVMRWHDERSRKWLAALAIVGGLAVLSKHNTAVGLIGGACLVVALGGGAVDAVVVGVGTVVAAAALLLVLSPFASVPGFVADVLVHGAEPKGGAATMWSNLGEYAAQLVHFRTVAVPTRVASGLLQASFFLAVAGMLVRRRSALAALTTVTVLAALAHSLSTSLFRWWYDVNPLIPVAFAWVVVLAGAVPWRMLAATAVLLAITWGSYGPEIARRLDACTVPWPEVAAYAGARMPARADGLRTLIARVRALSTPTDRVLLLPNDPDLASAFGRPAPALSSLILFVDQYWERFVDADFARIRADPPAIIVVGPMSTLGFQWYWNGDKRRTDRLIRHVMRDLAPTAYEPPEAWPFTRNDGSRDVMRLYVRRGVPSG